MLGKSGKVLENRGSGHVEKVTKCWICSESAYLLGVLAEMLTELTARSVEIELHIVLLYSSSRAGVLFMNLNGNVGSLLWVGSW